MTLLRISYLFVIVGISLLASPLSGANETEAKIALQAAVADVKSRFENNPDIRFAFKGVSRESAGTKDKNSKVDEEDSRSDLVFVYDPALPKGQQYQLLHPTEVENADDRKQALLVRETEQAAHDKVSNNKGDDQRLVFNMVDRDTTLDVIDTAKYLKETDTDWIFSITPSVNDLGLEGLNDIDLLGSDADNNMSDMERKMMKKIKSRLPKFIKSVKGELMVDKTHKRISGTRIYFTKNLKIITGVKLQKMEIITNYAPIWSGGPLVEQRSTAKTQIKLFLIKIGTTDTTVYSDFEPRNVSVNP